MSILVIVLNQALLLALDLVPNWIAISEVDSAFAKLLPALSSRRSSEDSCARMLLLSFCLCCAQTTGLALRLLATTSVVLT